MIKNKKSNAFFDPLAVLGAGLAQDDEKRRRAGDG